VLTKAAAEARAANTVPQGCRQESNAALSDAAALLEKRHNNNDRNNGTEVKRFSGGYGRFGRWSVQK